MSELLAPFGASPEVVEQPADVSEASPRTPVFITEQQVLFRHRCGSAVAAGQDQSTLGRGGARYRSEL